MNSFSIYTLDFFINLFYIIVSYLTCWLIFFNYIEILFLFEVYPLLLILPTRRFILTQITQLFSTIWFYCFAISTIFIYPLINKQLQFFLSSGWFLFQLELFNILLNSFFYIFIFLSSLTHLFLTPNILDFFLYWEILDEYSLLRIEAEFSFYFYVVWFFYFKLAFSFLITLFLKILLYLFYVIQINYLLFYTLKYKKVITFSIIATLFIFIPPDLITQVLVTFFILLFGEFYSYFICLKYSIKNADIKTITQKTTYENSKNKIYFFSKCASKKSNLCTSVHNKP